MVFALEAPAVGAESPVRKKSYGRPILFAVAGAALLAGAIATWFFWPAGVAVVRPARGTAIVAVYGSGTVEPVVMLPLAPRLGARLVRLNVDEGAVVGPGAVLGRLEADDLAGNVAQLKAQEEFARGDFARNQVLLAGGAVSRQTYDRSLAAWNQAKAAVAQARAQSGFMDLVSPGHCRVIQRDGELGQYLAPNTPVFWLSCQPALRASVQIDEEDVPSVRAGQKVLLRADAFPGKIFAGTVTAITPRGDPVARSYRVRIALPAATPLQIGMTTEANILVSEHANALLLPDSAVKAGKVARIVDGHVAMTGVVIGAQSNGQVEVTKGLRADDIVLRDIAQAPPDGTRIRVQGP